MRPLVKHTLRAFLFATALAALAPRQARAQVQPTASSALCVGGAIGCSQIDFFLEFLDIPSTGLAFDFFTLSSTNAAFRFATPGVTEAADALGLNFYNPTVSADGSTLSGTFDFGAFVHPELGNTLRLRIEMETVPAGAVDASGFSYAYSVKSGGEDVAAGASAPVTVTPEPGTLVLAASGLGLLVYVKRRRTRSAIARLATASALFVASCAEPSMAPRHPSGASSRQVGQAGAPGTNDPVTPSFPFDSATIGPLPFNGLIGVIIHTQYLISACEPIPQQAPFFLGRCVFMNGRPGFPPRTVNGNMFFGGLNNQRILCLSSVLAVFDSDGNPVVDGQHCYRLPIEGGEIWFGTPAYRYPGKFLIKTKSATLGVRG